MRFFVPDARLSAVASLVPCGSVLCDVGTDHARLPVRLLLDGLISYAIVSDIAEKPLKSAERTAMKFGVYDKMDFVLCDGVPHEAVARADVFIIAGMGGGTIAGILSRATLPDGARLILQPMSSLEDLRKLLFSENYTINSEILATDDRRRYVIIEASVGGTVEKFDRFDLIAGRHIGDGDYIESCKKRYENELMWSEYHAKRR